MNYIAYLHKDRKSDFGVSFPDFPGCVTAGKTPDEASRLAGEALGCISREWLKMVTAFLNLPRLTIWLRIPR
jgi:hypothetical protein